MILPSLNTLNRQLWTPEQGHSGLIVIARQRPLLAVMGGHLVEMKSLSQTRDTYATDTGRNLSRTPGGLIIVSHSRRKEPARIVGHPDLASGASVQRGETLYVSIAEAVYLQSRGENVELHFAPDADDAEALQDLKTRARSRWENDRLPDGWTRPLPPPPTPKTTDVESVPDELRALADALRERRAPQRDE